MATDEDKQRRKEEARARKQERKEERAKEKAEMKEKRAKEKALAKEKRAENKALEREISQVYKNNIKRFNKVVSDLWGRVKLSTESKIQRNHYKKTIGDMQTEVTDVYLSYVRNDLKTYALEDIQRHKEQVEKRRQEKEEKREKRREERKETREKRNYERQFDEEGNVTSLRKKTYCEKHPSACNAGKSLKEGSFKAGKTISESVAKWFKESDSKPKSSPSYDDYEDYDDEPKRTPKTKTKKQSEGKKSTSSQSKSKPKAKPKTRTSAPKTERSGSRLPAVFEDDEPRRRSRKSESDSGLPSAFAESPRRKSTTKKTTATKTKSTATKKTTTKGKTSKAKSTKSKTQTKKKSPPKKKDDWWGSGDAGLFD